MNRLARRIRMGSVAGGGGGGGAPAVVSTTSVDSSYASNTSVALSRAVASGNTLIVIVKSTLVSGCTDNQGNTYTLDYTSTNSAQRIYRRSNITNGPTSVIFTNGGDILHTRAFECSGLNVSPVSVVNTDTTDAASATSSTRSITTLTANELVFGYMYISSTFQTSSITPTGAVNVPADMSTATNLSAFYFAATTATTYSMVETIAAAQANRMMMTLSYKA